MSTTPDERITRAIGGDRDALAELLDAETAALRARFSRRIPPRCQAVFGIDDLLQLTFTDAFLSIQRFEARGPGALHAWLVALTERNLQDAIRLTDAEKRGGGRVVSGAPSSTRTALIQRVADSTSSPSQCLARGEQGGALERALAGLPTLHRTVVQLVDLDGRPVDEVAAWVGRSSGAVYMLRVRAHRWLADLLIDPLAARGNSHPVQERSSRAGPSFSKL